MQPWKVQSGGSAADNEPRRGYGDDGSSVDGNAHLPPYTREVRHSRLTSLYLSVIVIVVPGLDEEAICE